MAEQWGQCLSFWVDSFCFCTILILSSKYSEPYWFIAACTKWLPVLYRYYSKNLIFFLFLSPLIWRVAFQFPDNVILLKKKCVPTLGFFSLSYKFCVSSPQLSVVFPEMSSPMAPFQSVQSQGLSPPNLPPYEACTLNHPCTCHKAPFQPQCHQALPLNLGIFKQPEDLTRIYTKFPQTKHTIKNQQGVDFLFSSPCWKHLEF